MNKNKFEYVGEMNFRDKVDISDPCYDRDGSCNIIDYSISEGKYRCYIKYGEGYWDENRIAEIAIVKKGHIGVEDEEHLWDFVDYIGVDAGLAGFFNHKIEYSNSAWSDFCDRLGTGNGEQWWVNFDNGFFSDSGWGDGRYAVYEYIHNNVVKGLKIVFIEKFEEDKEDGEE